MPHIAEGLLHAHLDGALGPDGQLQWTAAERHLEVCADCRERLEEARQLRARARELLAGAAPAVRPGPGFAALTAEAGARRAGAGDGEDRGTSGGPSGRSVARSDGTTAWWRSTARLAWAASLMMAAGAGWLGHELLMEQGGAPPAAVSERSADEALAGEGFADAAGATADAPAPAAARAVPEQAEAREAAPEPVPAEPGAPADRLDEFRIQGQMAKASDEGPRCFGAAEVDEEVGLSRPLGVLRLAVDETVRLGTAAGTLVGFWSVLPGDSLSVRVTDGSAWIELRLSDARDGLSGTAASGAAISFRSADCSAR